MGLSRNGQAIPLRPRSSSWCGWPAQAGTTTASWRDQLCPELSPGIGERRGNAPNKSWAGGSRIPIQSGPARAVLLPLGAWPRNRGVHEPSSFRHLSFAEWILWKISGINNSRSIVSIWHTSRAVAQSGMNGMSVSSGFWPHPVSRLCTWPRWWVWWLNRCVTSSHLGPGHILAHRPGEPRDVTEQIGRCHSLFPADKGGVEIDAAPPEVNPIGNSRYTLSNCGGVNRLHGGVASEAPQPDLITEQSVA